jgi:uncharacterized protein involved in type VI secretion and phage assembly
MKQLIETNDLVLLSWVEALLKDSGIDSFVFDSSASVFGSMPMVQRRVMVADEDLAAAQRLLDEAKIEYEKK